jgi:hypothetical protein
MPTFQKSYWFVLLAAGEAIVLALTAGAVFEFVPVCSLAAAGDAVVSTLAFGEAVVTGESAGFAVVSKTERVPVKAGCASKNPSNIKAVAAPIVILAKTL